MDIPIIYTGLRPGEKLYEELLMDEEGLRETANQLIHIGQPIDMDDEAFCRSWRCWSRPARATAGHPPICGGPWCPHITPKQIKEHKSIPLAGNAKGMLFA